MRPFDIGNLKSYRDFKGPWGLSDMHQIGQCYSGWETILSVSLGLF